MTDSRYAHFRALREMVYADLSQAGILADWLKENDRWRLGELLRKRTNQWSYWRNWNLKAGGENYAVRARWLFLCDDDRTFRNYLKRLKHGFRPRKPNIVHEVASSMPPRRHYPR